MATEKLTIVAPLTVRLTESLDRDIRGLSDLHGMERGEFIRYLVAEEKKRQQEIWAARNRLFSNQPPAATVTASDNA